MASLIISSSAVTAVMSRATSSQARQVVVPFKGTKLSNSAVTSSLVAAPFTGLKSNSTFPMSRKVDNITSLSSNGGRAKCLATGVSTLYGPLPITKANDDSWISGNGNSIEFQGGDLKNWVEVDVSKLDRGRKYQVIYYVTMKAHPMVESYFTLKIAYPDRTTSTSTKQYIVKPGVLTDISFEEFRQTFSSGGKIKYTFDSPDPALWVGLIIQEVIISPA